MTKPQLIGLKLKNKYPWLFLEKKLLVDIIYDFTDSNLETDERELSAGTDTVETATQIAQALKQSGHSTNKIPINHKNYNKILENLKGDIVFNQVEEDNLGFKVLKKLEQLGKKVTGVDSLGFALSWNKDKIKKALAQNGVPTPNSKNLSFPMFVKAADDHGSLSVTKKSIVRNKEELTKQIEWVKETIGGKALVEEYIEGKELSVGFLGNKDKLLLFPTKEIVLNSQSIISYNSKWNDKSPDYLNDSSIKCPATLTKIQNKNIEESVKKAIRILKARDYGRFDIRLKGDIPYIIDYNANPWIGPDGPFRLPFDTLGLTYPEFIQAIITVALYRYNI